MVAFKVGIPVLDGFGKSGSTSKNTRARISTQETTYQISFSEQYRSVLFRCFRQIVGVVIDPNNRIFIHLHLHNDYKVHDAA